MIGSDKLSGCEGIFRVCSIGVHRFPGGILSPIPYRIAGKTPEIVDFLAIDRYNRQDASTAHAIVGPVSQCVLVSRLAVYRQVRFLSIS